MKRTTIPYLLLLAVIALSSCAEKAVAPREYVSLVNHHDQLNREITLDSNLALKVAMRPVDYRICMALRSDSISSGAYEEQNERLGNNIGFVVSMTSRDNESVIKHLENKLALDKERILKYFNYEAGADFVLLSQSNDTLQRELYHYEYSYQLTPEERFNVVFELPEKSQWPLTLLVAHPTEGTYERFEFHSQDFFGLPKIKLI